MKKINKVFLGIGALTMLASDALAITLASNPKEAVQANATSGTISVNINVNWSSAACKIALYFYNDTQNEWSGLVSASQGDYLIDIPYNVSIEPTHMIAVRYSPDRTTTGFDNIWNQTNNLDFSNHIAITGPTSAVTGFPVVKGGPSGQAWSDLATLTHVKKNSDNYHVEYYGEVTLTNQSFKSVFGGDYYGYYSTYSQISSNFSGGGESDINTLVGGTYEFYFDAETHNTYITDPVIAAADEWSVSFLRDVECDPQGVNLPAGWATVAASYAAITNGDVKDYIYGMAASSDPAASATAKAVYQYDWAVVHHPELEKFIKDSHDNVRTPHIVAGNSPISFTTDDVGKVIATVVIVSLVAVTTIGGIIILRRKER